MEINDRGSYWGVTEQLADGEEIVTPVKKMCGKTVTKRVEAALLSDAGFFFAAMRADETEL